MQIGTDLRPMFSYSILLIIIILILIISFVVFLVVTKKKKESVVQEVIVPNHKDLVSIKKKYLSQIQVLLDDFNNKKISSRKAYQKLSSLIRNFVFEMTNIKMQNCTLKDIKSLNMPVLYELVSEYYDPEFSKVSKGNITSSIEKTRAVINKWR